MPPIDAHERVLAAATSCSAEQQTAEERWTR